MQLDDKYIKELIILKLKKYYEFVKGEEYKNSLINSNNIYFYNKNKYQILKINSFYFKLTILGFNIIFIFSQYYKKWNSKNRKNFKCCKN